MENPSSDLLHPELDGGPFYWKAGPIGVLLVHGFTATTVEVRPLAKALHALGYTVAGPLLPGHGTSPQDLNRKKWTDWTAAVDDAYQGLAIHCDVIVAGGESMGGLLALYLASQHPEIAALLLYAPAYHIPRLFLSEWLYYFRPLAAKRAGGDDDMPWQGYRVNPLHAAGQLYQLQRQVRKRITKVRQPVLILQGKRDQTIDPRSAQMVYDRIGSTRKELHWLENSSHVLLLDREFDTAARLTANFLKNTLADSVIIPETAEEPWRSNEQSPPTTR